jgi:hypothetical protein
MSINLDSCAARQAFCQTLTSLDGRRTGARPHVTSPTSHDVIWLNHAGLRLDMASVEAHAPRTKQSPPSDAREAAADALAIYEAKGDEPAAGWAHELLTSLG